MQALTHSLKSIRRGAMTWASVAAILVLAACSEDPLDPTRSGAEATIEATATELGRDIARVLITVDAEDMEAIAGELETDGGGSAGGTIAAPAGLDRNVTIRGYDADGREIRRGATTIDLEPGAIQSVELALSPLNSSGGGGGGGIELGDHGS